MMNEVESIISAAHFAKQTTGGVDLLCGNSSTFKVTLGRFIEFLLVIGFLNRSLISSSTVDVAVAVNAVIGTLGKSDFNFLRSLKEILKSFHSVNRCASSMAISDKSLAWIRECNLD